MSAKNTKSTPVTRQERTFARFSTGQRWEHLVLLVTCFVLLLTGLPQKYREWSISQDLLSTPQLITLIRQIHHYTAILLGLLVLYHLVRIFVMMSRRRLPGDLLPTVQDLRDAGHMIQYLLFLRKDKPEFGRYNFEQKVTYWVIFFSILIMGVSGLIVWFPVQATLFLPGGVVPAAKLMHSTESVVMGIFILIWHFYHVHIERLNLSIFTGRLGENEMRRFHAKEYERLTSRTGEKK
jgi:formate dehydrogenase gamma subunit